MAECTTTEFLSEADLLESFRISGFNRKYSANVNALLRTAEERCELLGMNLTWSEFLRQVSIRSLVVKDKTATLDLAALRSLFGLLLSARTSADKSGIRISPRDALPRKIELPIWLDDGDWKAIERVEAWFEGQTVSNLRNKAVRILPSMRKELALCSDFGTDGERIVTLAGVGNTEWILDSRREPQKRWAGISTRMFHELLSALHADWSGRSDDFLSAPNLDDRVGLACLLATTAWLTGMRSVEIYAFRIMEPVPGTDIDRILDDPLHAFETGLLEPAKVKPLETCQGHEKGSDRWPKILIIRTAKSDLASPLIDNRIRAQILTGIEPRHLDTLYRASKLRSLKLSRARIGNLNKSCTELIRIASQKAFPTRADPITLHTLRHAFIDAARHQMSAAELAALSGHTSPVTLAGYGGKTKRTSSFRPIPRWLPQPDPVRVQAFEAVWDSESAIHPQAEVDNVVDSSGPEFTPV